MSATNLTDIVKSLSNSTIKNSIYVPVTTWEMRLQANWQPLFGYSLGTVLCILIIYISIFSKHITGDYKWFVLNQALANIVFAIGSLSWTLVVDVRYTLVGFLRLYDSAAPPLWVSIYYNVAFLLMSTLGENARVFSLFATVFNRWMAIVMPDHYQKFMSTRLIVLYCTLCYVVVIFNNENLKKMMKIPNVAQLLILAGFFMIPWLLSIILSVNILFKLWNHMRTTTTITDKRRLQESRMVLYSLIIQIIVLFVEKIPDHVFFIYLNLHAVTRNNFGLDTLVGVLNKIDPIREMYTGAYTGIIIFITMRPYRRALLSLISPITKFCLHHLKPNLTPTTTDNRVTPKPNVVNVQPARRANSP